MVGTSMIPVSMRDEYLGGAIATAIYSSIMSKRFSGVLPGKVAAAVLPLGFDVKELGELIEALWSGSAEAV